MFGGASGGDQGSGEEALFHFYGREVLKDALPVLLISDPVRDALIRVATKRGGAAEERGEVPPHRSDHREGLRR